MRSSLLSDLLSHKTLETTRIYFAAQQSNMKSSTRWWTGNKITGHRLQSYTWRNHFENTVEQFKNIPEKAGDAQLRLSLLCLLSLNVYFHFLR